MAFFDLNDLEYHEESRVSTLFNIQRDIIVVKLYYYSSSKLKFGILECVSKFEIVIRRSLPWQTGNEFLNVYIKNSQMSKHYKGFGSK